ncbi:LacI family DNA-binding transcriptional regulator [Mesohalobacter halotolerans]|uniref:LacI family transcriptional regulator n=1 Tax=Mesohalobacter halotolerans TaxID=1883405 RepID=A0A4U5TP29_9FLAO|nr:LacI family DNA-binding transcriptional regulator [Mesohalobacter halotolerans]MBS3739170.1 LacI family DNA-binding transcriptional regulator [Psychroflexus sp.]TKS55673.1 LacI family transcriptional regulator [Mesohalobacter halotolerans]
MNSKINSRVRLEDLARALKLSIATVSRAMSDSSRVKPETKQRVLSKAKQMGYRSNQIAKSLSSGKTNVLGVIIPRYDEPFFIEVCRGIDYYVRKHDYRILINSSRNSFKYEKENVLAFERGTVDGVAMCFTHETNSYEHVEELIDRKMPLVLFDNISHKIDGAGHVKIDDFSSAVKAVEILIKHKNNSIGYIGGTSKKSVFNQRFDGFVEAHKKHHQSFKTRHVLNCKSYHQEHEFYEVFNFLSKLQDVPNAFFCSTDNYAILCIKALTKLGYKVPQDIEVIGFGNLHYSNMFTPELTCVSQPSFKMGEKVAEMLLNKIDKGFFISNTDQNSEIVLPTKLVYRDTTR